MMSPTTGQARNLVHRTAGIAFRVLRSVAVAWVLVILLVAIFQRSITYFPQRATAAEVTAAAARHGLEPWRARNGEIIGWRPPRTANRAANRMLVFHGNAGFALHRTYYADGFGALDQGAKWEVHLFEYPGYGARAGQPGEKSFIEAAAAALAEMQAEDARPIFLLGESIGSGTACALAGQHAEAIAGICLVTPFARFAEVAAHHYPFIPVRLILRDRWDNVAGLSTYRGRLAMWIAGRDEIVTPEQGHRLFESWGGSKQSWVNPTSDHNTMDYLPSNPWWRETSDFLLGDR